MILHIQRGIQDILRDYMFNQIYSNFWTRTKLVLLLFDVNKREEKWAGRGQEGIFFWFV